MKLAIVVPCYNEGKRFPKKAFHKFIVESPNVDLILVNDGSADNTSEVLVSFEKEFSKQVFVLELKENKGKANAVRQGVLYATKLKEYEKIAYLDADLSTSLEECFQLSEKVNKDISFVFGSRKQLENNKIERKSYRHFIGRIVAFTIARILGIEVYDTQCGCKIIEGNLAKKLFAEDFLSKWLFDVELFFRMIHIYGKEGMVMKSKEVFLEKWVDIEESSVELSYAFQLWIDLFKIYRKYR